MRRTLPNEDSSQDILDRGESEERARTTLVLAKAKYN